MNCPECSSVRFKVVDMRRCVGYIRRRRECLDCASRWTTTEVSGQAPAVVSTVLDMDEEDLADALRARRILTAAACEYYGVGDEDDDAAETDQQSMSEKQS